MKYKRLCRAVPAVLAALGVLCTPLAASAIDPAWSPSSAYRASTYYQNLKTVPATGDEAFDTVSVALSQIGYHEANSAAGYGGTTSGSGNYTEYNLAYGRVGGTYAYAWCAAFVSWCLVQAGAGERAGGLFASCTLWLEELTELGQYRTRSTGYSPKAGDLIFFRSSGTARASDHVGIVRYVKNGRVYTVEGNSSDRVSLRDYALTDTYIVGYGLPSYGGKTLGVSRTAAEDVAPGVYAVTYDFLNVRATASQSATKRGTLSRGACVTVRSIKNGWGEIEYGGKTAYISLEYADFVAPYSFTVRYVSAGSELYVGTYYSTDTPRVLSTAPAREGYVFLHWEDGAGAVLKAGDTLTAATRTLTAVFEAIPVIEEPSTPDIPSDGADIPPNDTDTPLGGGENGSQDVEVTPPTWDAPPADPLPDVAPEIDAASVRATRHAGVVSGLLAAVLGGVWWYRRKERA